MFTRKPNVEKIPALRYGGDSAAAELVDAQYGFDAVCSHDPKWKKARPCRIGMRMNFIRKVDIEESSFDACLVLQLVWQVRHEELGKELTRKIADNSISIELDIPDLRCFTTSVLRNHLRQDASLNWNMLRVPTPDFVNAIEMDKRGDLLFANTSMPDKVEFQNQTVHYGSFNEDFQLVRFPFDVQSLHIQVRFARRDKLKLQRLCMKSHHYSVDGKDLGTALVFHPRYYNFNYKTHMPIVGINYVCKGLHLSNKDMCVHFQPQVNFVILLSRAADYFVHNVYLPMFGVMCVGQLLHVHLCLPLTVVPVHVACAPAPLSSVCSC